MSITSLNDLYKKERAAVKRSFLVYKKRNTYNKKIKKIYSIIKDHMNYDVHPDLDKYRNRWQALSKNINPAWYITYTLISGNCDIDYVPEDLYYSIIEPILNDYTTAKCYSDKNYYDKYYSDLDIFPKTLLRNINGTFYTKDYEFISSIDPIENYLDNLSKIILKPSLISGGGRNVEVFYRKEDGAYFNSKGEKLTKNYLDAKYQRDYLFQEFIESHSYFKQFNPTSLNTVRVLTYRSIKTNDVMASNCGLRMGKKGAEVDNVSLGGVFCFIDESARLSPFALDVFGNRCFSLPSDPDMKFCDVEKVPYIDKVKELAVEIARRNTYHRMLGLDFCIDENKDVRLIEINNWGNDINIFQMHGKPLYREYTDEVLEYCAEKFHANIKYIL